MAEQETRDRASFLIKTHGCKVNQYESQLIREQLVQAGFNECVAGEQPSLCIVNTCTVTEQSDAKSRQSLRKFIRKHPKALIVAVGCYVEAEDEMLKEIDGVDLLINNAGKVDFIAGITPLIRCRNSFRPPTSISRFAGHTRAFIKVQNGCNNYCSYCKVPYVRGRSKSRDIIEILSEARAVAINGFREIVVTGIHLGDFGKSADISRHRLPELLEGLAAIEEVQRVRLSSIDPDEVTDELISAITGCPKVCHHLHISIQSGSDRVLERMNRRYSRQVCLDLARRLYQLIPDISISTDVMVGFPGETEEDFGNSVKLIEQIGFSKVHIFSFSPRPGTAAVSMPDHVASKTIKDRAVRIQEAASRAALRHRQKFIGSIQQILVERFEPVEKKALGLTDNYLRCEVNCPRIEDNGLEKQVISTKIQNVDTKLLYGERICEKKAL